MNLNEIPVILIIIPILLIFAVVAFIVLKQSSRDSQLYDKRWKIYNRSQHSHNK